MREWSSIFRRLLASLALLCRGKQKRIREEESRGEESEGSAEVGLVYLHGTLRGQAGV